MSQPMPNLPPPSAADFVLQPDEQRLAASVVDLADAVLITRANLDAPGPTIIAASRGMTALTQYQIADLVGRTPRIFQGPLTDRPVLKQLREACAQGARFLGETINYRKDGSTYVVRWTVDPIHDRAGRVTHFFSLQHDLTAQRPFAREWLEAEARAEAALRQASAQLRLIAEAILVLERTKRSFRSKELGELRARLASVSDGAAPAADRGAAPKR